MEINRENVCRLCGKVFCCSNCKKKHISEEHSTETFPDCPLCSNNELVLRYSKVDQFFSHIIQHHLPLGCIKCNQVIESEVDLRKLEPSCLLVKVNRPEIVVSCEKDAEKVPEKAVKMESIGVQTATPQSNFTPKFVQKASNKPSSSSLARSASATYMTANHTRVTTARLIRGTSTPTTQELMSVLKTSNHFMNGSVSQMSSIFNQSSEISLSSPIILPMGCAPMAPKIDKFKLPFQQKRPGGANATPLRQVISQNVQRALMKHDLMSTSITASPVPLPLDLRTKRRSITAVSPKELNIEEVVDEEETPNTDSLVPSEPVLLKTPTSRTPGKNNSDESADDCVYYTPVENYRRRRSSIITCVRYEEYDEVTVPQDLVPSWELVPRDYQEDTQTTYDSPVALAQIEAPEEPEKKLSLWNVVSSVFRLASKNIVARIDPGNDSLSQSEESITLSTKRRLQSPNSNQQSPQQQSPWNPPKRTRIRGRPPIARMRKLQDSDF